MTGSADMGEKDLISSAAEELARVQAEVRDLQKRQQELQTFLSVAKTLNPAGQPSDASSIASQEARPGTTKAKILGIADELVSKNGHATTREILDAAQARGIEIGGKTPTLAISKTMGGSPSFRLEDRRTGWMKK